MTKSFTLLTIALLLLATARTAFSGPRSPAPSETALYAVTFESSWSPETHPAADFPANAHYSRMHGALHNANVAFWAAGELASAGMESMAETGGYATLEGEVKEAITAGTAEQFLLGDNLGSSTGTILFASVTVQRDFPLLTLVTMVAPSPDWFVGVNGLSLLDANGEWINQGSMMLYPYDAGTDTGATYGAPNADAVPPQPVANISGEAPFSTEPMGLFSFVRLDAPTATPTDAPNTPVTSTPTLDITPTGTPAAGQTITPTPTVSCPTATPEPLQVDYLSPTMLLTQTLGVRIGNGDAVTITAPTGIYTATGEFEFNRPALLTIDLQPAQANEIHVAAHVRKAISVGPCRFGDYTLSQTFAIVQQETVDGHRFFMPLIWDLKDGN